MRLPRAIALLAVLTVLAVSACAGEVAAPVTETVARGALAISVRGGGELVAAKATPLRVPGANWTQRRLEWMLPEGSFVRKGEVIARFSSDEGKQDLAQAMVDLQRNALARLAKESDLLAGQGRVAVDLSQVGVQLGIAERYASADLSTLARNEVLDAVQDAAFLHDKQDTLEWRRDRSSVRGGAELGVLDAQRATYRINADARQQDLDALELRAPNDGVLLLATNWAGEKPVTGAAMNAGLDYGSLPDASTMQAEILLPQIEAQGVAVGNLVELHPVGRPRQAIRTRLTWVASTAKVRSNQSPVKYLSMRAPIPAAAIRKLGLVPGQQIEARVVMLAAADAISVSNIALRGENGHSFVQVRDGSGFEKREVVLGARGTARSQVVAGLKPGDEIMIAPAQAEPSTDGDTPAAAAPNGESAA